MPITINGSTGITFPDGTTQSDGLTVPVPVADGGTGATTANQALTNLGGNGFGFKNRIINGAMMIDQRNAGASVTPASGTYTYTIDRFRGYATAASKYTVQQNAGSVTPPAGFTNYLGATSSSAYSVGSSDTFFLSQVIEGYNIADLGWGTANAQPVTLSFWVRSSLTGTFGGSLRNVDTPNRSYPFSYTISAANTWEQKTITIAGDTTGTWNTTNGQGIQVQWNLGSGSTFSGTAGSWQSGNLIAPTGATSVVGTNGATFYITGVQLEKGSTATSFDYRPYGTELALCQRYYQINRMSNLTQSLVSASGGNLSVNFQCPVFMRTSPTVEWNLTNANYGSLWVLDVAFVTGSVGKTGTVVINGIAGFNSYGLALTGATWASTPNLFYVASTGYISASTEL